MSLFEWDIWISFLFTINSTNLIATTACCHLGFSSALSSTCRWLLFTSRNHSPKSNSHSPYWFNSISILQRQNLFAHPPRFHAHSLSSPGTYVELLRNQTYLPIKNWTHKNDNIHIIRPPHTHTWVTNSPSNYKLLTDKLQFPASLLLPLKQKHTPSM